jgi:Flp pilus assembly CpaF family ATPase
MNTSPVVATHEDGERTNASPPPRAPLGSSGSVPAFRSQDVAVLVQTVNQQTLAHHQLATTLEVVGKATGDMVAVMSQFY